MFALHFAMLLFTRRITVLERGSPHSVPIMECGKVCSECAMCGVCYVWCVLCVLCVSCVLCM